MQKSIPGVPMEFQGYRIENPEALARNILKAYEAAGKAISGMIERADAKSGPFSAATEMSEATKTLTDISQHWMADPARLVEAQGELMSGYTQLWNNTLRRMMGEQVEPVARPEVGDNRFKDPECRTIPTSISGSRPT